MCISSCSRLDYSGIALLIIGSFIPALYYGFYCSFVLKVVYMSSICFLGTCCIVVSLWSKFSTPKYRVLRAGTINITLKSVNLGKSLCKLFASLAYIHSKMFKFWKRSAKQCEFCAVGKISVFWPQGPQFNGLTGLLMNRSKEDVGWRTLNID